MGRRKKVKKAPDAKALRPMKDDLRAYRALSYGEDMARKLPKFVPLADKLDQAFNAGEQHKSDWASGVIKEKNERIKELEEKLMNCESERKTLFWAVRKLAQP